MAGQNKRKRQNRKKEGKREGLLVFGFFLFLLMAASIYFQSMTGIVGAKVGNFFFTLFGLMAYGIPLLFLLFLCTEWARQWRSKFGGSVLFVFALFFCLSLVLWTRVNPDGSFQTSMEMAGEWGLVKRGPGLFGGFFGFLFSKVIGSIGIYLLSFFCVFFFLLHLFDLGFVEFFQIMGHAFSGLFEKTRRSVREFKEASSRKKEEKKKDDPFPLTREGRKESQSETFNQEVSGPLLQFDQEEWKEEKKEEVLPVKKDPIPINDYARHQGVDHSIKDESFTESADEDLAFSVDKKEVDYIPPSFDLLRSPTHSSDMNPQVLKKNARIIESTLASFGIESEVVSIQRGPTVALYELKPAAGVKVSRITNLADDLALSLAAADIRIEAPIPGKPYVGIEVPNPSADMVCLREIFEAPEFSQAKDSLPVALGQSISGKPIVAKIAKMPHLLIAGATGSGKSVCINTIILSLIYKYSPSDLRMVLVDPKVVELSVYNEIPHLLIPVVTDPKKAAKALYTAVQEMERRFKLFSKYSVRDIQGYREKCLVEEGMEKLPFIVVIIDELSDLMMVASKDVEAHITRLAQMARACGIHLIIATQRPSVDVITGTIKANIPSRISFQVSSSIDSRTILDQSGAETLLGKGDMLYYPSNLPKPKRVQGAFVSDDEVSKVVGFIKEKHNAQYDTSFIEKIEKDPSSGNDGGGEDEPMDDLMDEVLEFISHEETTSISGLQRRFRIGYARAGRIIDDLESIGAVSPQDGSKPREVLVQGDPEEWKERNLNEPAE
ncbi:FtsK/SpoIIIE family DNA translocase [Kallipyga massiliensis]|uniref:FtsK/SpoIIIE family DNA translocase n=1 Tax=Kallipyga massiliensis TaxID=1472764 RepID=UPI0004B4BD59|nr:DNA translocase FtsK [Kallipyga massiliensis]